MHQPPIQHRPKATAFRGRADSERGAMALIVAFSLAFVCVPVMALVIMSGFLFNSRLQLTDYADAVSASWGLQMSETGTQAWGNRMFDLTVLAQQQGYTTSLPTLTSWQLTPSPVFSDGFNHYSPAYINVAVSSPWAQASMASTLLQVAAPTVLTQTSLRRVNQITLGSNTLYRQPVMLMLDTSSTMRLPYEGPKGNSGESAGDALKRVADQLITESTLVYDLGIMGFSDGVADASQKVDPGGSKDATDLNEAWSEESAHRGALKTMVDGLVSNGDGTDIESAIQRAGTAITNASTGAPFQKPLLILVTDGEPNISHTAKKGSTASLETLQQEAAADATTSMQGQWNMTNNGRPAYVDSLVLQMQRQAVTAGLNEADTQFLQGVAGNHNHQSGDPNYFHQDGGDPDRLAYYMQVQPKYVFCQFEPLSNAVGLKSNNASAPDPNADIITAFLYLGDSSTELTIPQDHIFTDRNAFNAWASDPMHAAYLTAGSDLNAQNITNVPIGGTQTGYDVLRQSDGTAADALGVYYDTDTTQVWVSGMLCAAMNLPILNQPGHELQLRVRYGYPQLSDKTSTSTGP